MIDLLQKLISFKTTQNNPREIQRGFEFISSLFDPGVFNTQIFEKNQKYSLLIFFKGRDAFKSKILLNGHFDVVPAEDENQYKLRVEGSRAYGRGTVDMKGMVAVLVTVMQELGKEKNLPSVALLLNGDEEVGGESGAGYCARELGIKPGFLFCADGPDEQKLKITTKEKGVLWLELLAKGKTAHGAYPWLGENAIDKLTDAIQKIKKFVGAMEPEVWKSTLNVGVIETDNKTPNKVPAGARAVIDIRFTEELAKTPEELAEKIQKLVPGVTLRVLEKGSLLFVEENNSFLQQFEKAAESVVGKEVPFAFEHGATDARYFAEIGVPCAVFGAVGGNMHAEGEWVDLESLELNKQILLKFLQVS
ncbi:MAG: M20/M25/M40 family metallo-hydrolase [Candidatus Wildermuthbacteria bacterium]|nr:M20/M25/M40 family metallo-hydrolase [Candidatus Wildermuthbacteria bacterium]